LILSLRSLLFLSALREIQTDSEKIGVEYFHAKAAKLKTQRTEDLILSLRSLLFLICFA
jgi:hypothetical protein